MSVSCEAYIGYTVTLKENLNSDDFDFNAPPSEKHVKAVSKKNEICKCFQKK